MAKRVLLYYTSFIRVGRRIVDKSSEREVLSEIRDTLSSLGASLINDKPYKFYGRYKEEHYFYEVPEQGTIDLEICYDRRRKNPLVNGIAMIVMGFDSKSDLPRKLGDEMRQKIWGTPQESSKQVA